MPLPRPLAITPDFADTAPLTEAAYLGRPASVSPLCIAGCGCGPAHLQRITRAWWMRALPGLRLYLCLRCARRVLRTRLRPNAAYFGVVFRETRQVRVRNEKAVRHD
jgi:hypothetical protein